MLNLRILIGGILVALALGGCDGTPEVLPGTLNIRVTHASPDAAKVNVEVQGPIALLGSSVLGPLGTFTLEGVDYKGSSGLVGVRVGNMSVSIEAIIPAGNQTIFDQAFPEDEDITYEVIVVGQSGNSTVEIVQLNNPVAEVPLGFFRTQFVHAAPASGDLVVYITPEGGTRDMGQTLTFKGNTLRDSSLAAGNYQIEVALASDPMMTPVFDSGVLPFPNGADLLIMLLENTATGSSPITLTFQDGIATTEILDVNAPSEVRFVHAIPDQATGLDIIVDDDTANPIVSGLTFGAFTDYIDPSLAPETYNFKFVDAADPDTIITNQNLTLDVGTFGTVLAAGLAAKAPLIPAFTEDDNRRIATEARLRVLHAANSTLDLNAIGAVDIYLANTGQPIGEDNLVFENVAFFTTTGYGSLAGNNYDLTVTETGSTSVILINALPITLADNGVYTAVAIDTAPGEEPLDFILLDDFVP